MKLSGVAPDSPEADNRNMDVNILAKSIVDQAVGDKPMKPHKAKSAQAVARGKARIASMDAAKVSEHARFAVNKRWRKPEETV